MHSNGQAIDRHNDEDSRILNDQWLGEREYFLDAEQAAKFLKLHPRTLQRLARTGRIPAHPLGNGVRKRWRFLLSELDAWLRCRVHSPLPPV